MSSLSIALIIAGYFAVLISISILTGRKADNNAFFLGNRNSPWYIVSIGMIGASLSGVTFISVPGWVASTQFTYMQMVFGYLLGYIVIANILLPLYYRLKLTSIYTYLEGRFGFYTYKSGASLFILSRTVGAAARLYLMANVLQLTLFDSLNIPFSITVIITILLIWIYTFKGGIKTIIWTDTLQTLFMLSSVIITIIMITKSLDLTFTDFLEQISAQKIDTIFVFDDWHATNHFIKHFISGAFITIVMTGLDQDMMQKNLTCKNIKEAKKNMYWYGISFIPANLLFLSLGALLMLFAAKNNIPMPERMDDFFPNIATQGHLPQSVTILFILGLVAAAYSSADSALTSLTTSFSVDLLNIQKKAAPSAKRIRIIVHIGFSILLAIVIILFRAFNQQSIISTIFTLAGYTYGPLLGLYSFGLITKLNIKDKMVPFLSILTPVITGILDYNALDWFGFKLGFEKLIINGLIMFLGLLIISKSRTKN